MVIDFHTHIFPDKIAARTIESLGAIAGVRAATDGTLKSMILGENAIRLLNGVFNRESYGIYTIL